MPDRIVALGARNLVRGLPTVVAFARAAWGPSVEVLAANGHGRSYGGRSAFLGRVLPGILECGIWRELVVPRGGGYRMSANEKFQTDNGKPTNGLPLTGCQLSVFSFSVHRRCG